MKRAWLRFYTVGLGGFGVHYLLLTFLKSVVGLHYIAATIIAVETAVLHNFYWHERWTWAHRNLEWSGTALRLARFNAGNGLVSLGGNILVMWVLVDQFKTHYMVAALAAIALCSLANYLISDRLVFRNSARRDAGETTSGETATRPQKARTARGGQG